LTFLSGEKISGKKHIWPRAIHSAQFFLLVRRKGSVCLHHPISLESRAEDNRKSVYWLHIHIEHASLDATDTKRPPQPTHPLEPNANNAAAESAACALNEKAQRRERERARTARLEL
jgi:hypothetical protein